MDLFGGRVDLRVCTKLRGDEHSTQLDQHVLIAGMRLGRVPARPLPVFVHDAGRVASEVEPDDHQALDETSQSTAGASGVGRVVEPLGGSEAAMGRCGPDDVPAMRAAIEQTLSENSYDRAAQRVADELRRMPNVVELASQMIQGGIHERP